MSYPLNLDEYTEEQLERKTRPQGEDSREGQVRLLRAQDRVQAGVQVP